jgi:molecular chaperone GrpE (heat shock protein)
MSDDRGPTRLAKWPFYLADLLLSAVIIFVLYQLGTFEGTTDMVIVAVCIAAAGVAAWISIIPWLKEHEASVHLSDSANLKSSLEQIKSVEKVADLIRQSNAQWQTVQEASARTVASAREITDRMKVEAEEFTKFLSHAHDQERAGLRLEVEKLRRMEADWIKVSVQTLDHVFALTRAAEQSGQANLIRQLHQFQNACRDVARRMGLSTFVPVIGEPFDARAHQLPNQQTPSQEGEKVQDVLASGFTYQGQLLRRSLVLIDSSASESAPGEPSRAPIAAETEPAEDASAFTPAAVEAAERVESPPSVETIEEPGADPVEITEPRADDGASAERDSGEPPAIIDTYTPAESEHVADFPPEEAMETIAESETPEEAPKSEPMVRGSRTKKRSGQEELPL